MSKGVIVLGTLIAFGASLMLFGNAAHADSFGYYAKACLPPLTECQEVLNHSSYQCDIEQAGDPGETFQQCFTVTPQTPTDELFTLGTFLWRNWVCECDSHGSPGAKDLRFGDSDSKFVCAAEVCGTVAWDGTEVAGGLRCQIGHDGQTLTMQGVANFFYSGSWGPQSFVAECQRVESCE